MLNEKIKQILIEKNLSPSHFADEIGVQRSSISHILAGRNKPSFDIIQKIIKRFPDLGYEWLMEEDTRTSRVEVATIPSNTKRAKHPINGQSNGSTVFPAGVQAKSVEANSPITPAEIAPKPVIINTPMTDKSVERILIFYSDKTFTEYKPI